MNNLDKYKSIFETIFDVGEESLNQSFNFKDIGAWDSMTHLMLISELESTFDVLFETDDIIHFGGYLNGIEILKKYGINFDD